MSVTRKGTKRGFLFKLVVFALLCWNSTPIWAYPLPCPPGFFSFGTSLSDTGEVAYSLPFATESEYLPYGETFFGRNAFRFSDGRLVVDFFALAFKYPLLAPYFQSVAPNFQHGVNFAASGATAINETNQIPFFLDFQVGQFLRFKRSTEIASQLPTIGCVNNLLPNGSTFDNGLYILSFGRNDFSIGYFVQGFTPVTAITQLVPLIVQFIVGGIQTLYNNGARSFLVFNVPPQGCSPQYLTIFGPSANLTDFDAFGCLTKYNKVNQAFNLELLAAVQGMRLSLTGSSILYFDYYAANIAVLSNPGAFGFAPEKTLQACCGIGGKYNYNPTLNCTHTGVFDNKTVTVGSCSNPNQYISWDGIHFTDAFNRVVAEQVLSGQFLDPPVDLKLNCNLDFSKFTGANFMEVYSNSGYLVLPDSN